MAPIVTQATDPVLLGEGPHWDHEDNALYFVGIPDYTVNKYVPATGTHTSTKFEYIPHFIIPVEGKKNHFMITQARKIVEIEWSGEDGAAKIVRTFAEVDHDQPNNQFNDAKADPRGRLFAGTMGPSLDINNMTEAVGSLYRFDGDGTAHKLATGMRLSNGMCWDLKERAFYYLDSLLYTIWRYDYDVETGNIANRREVFSLKENGLNGLADGITIDTDGNLWFAIYNGSQIVKFDPRTGKLLEQIPIPAKEVTSLTFGGPNLDVLYVTTGRIDKSPHPAGAIFAVTGIAARGHPNVKIKLN
ncbi:regucalcin-like [Trichoplusia ni]|uniref:Regucalcin n=1 Tax=Trichoplusia ni TaxID=7111 RepID=A0A7E5W8I3_TRINI|nr:regucalcin-like [Trichoplusia ni]